MAESEFADLAFDEGVASSEPFESPADETRLSCLGVKLRLKETFHRVATARALDLPVAYVEVAVLIVRWAGFLDKDLKCGAEVEELRKVFVEKYN